MVLRGKAAENHRGGLNNYYGRWFHSRPQLPARSQPRVLMTHHRPPPTTAAAKSSSSSSTKAIGATIGLVVLTYVVAANFSLQMGRQQNSAAAALGTVPSSSSSSSSSSSQLHTKRESQPQFSSMNQQLQRKKVTAPITMRKPDQASTDAGDERDDKVDAAIVNANPVGAIAKLPNKPESDAAVVVSSTKDVPDSMHPPLPTKSDTIAVAFLSDADFRQHRQTAEAAIQTDVATKLSFHKTLTAYIEPPLRDIVPGTGDRGNFKVDKDAGRPPKFVIPLPRRTHTPKDLRMIQYAKVQTCHDMPGKFPVDRGLEIDENGGVVVWNVGNTPTPPDFPQQEAPYCPVELDPFLPWIHDVFPSPDGTKIEFIAQNKRRCRTGIAYTENVNRLVPQVTLLQSVSVERVSESQARRLAPDLWHPDRDLAAAGTTTTTASPSRYRLAPYAEASTDGGMYTRFICRFHVTTVAEGIPVTVPLGETLSEYPFNYELVSYRKQQRSLLTAKGKDTTLFWTSNLHFQCPLPANNDALRHAVATGMTVLTDGTPTVYVDLVPIRTSARYAELHLTEDMIGPRNIWDYPAFDAKTRWGPDYVLPRVEASGRWANIPICLPPALVNEEIIKTVTDVDTFEKIEVSRKLVPNIAELTQKPHFLSACLWASTEFKTRGLRKGGSTDTLDRLQEWIEFHLMVGFDHIYVYDNSGAHTNETTLEPVIDLFPGKVTRIDWPAIVCNNNIPAHDSTGERSSQYAAENSCRTRYGPFTEWMAAFDTDEYFVPMGDYTSLKDVLVDVAKTGTNILSLRSSRGRLRMDKSNVVSNGKAIEKSADFTYLEAYNCDSAGSPKPSWADRARKQIYRTDYVLYHYVHYSTVTKGILQTYEEAQRQGETWIRHFGEEAPSERASDELTEVVMIHTKLLGRDMTASYKQRCRHDYKKKWQACWVAYPWPLVNGTQKKIEYDENGMSYNCYINARVEDYWVPKLRDALATRKKS